MALWLTLLVALIFLLGVTGRLMTKNQNKTVLTC